MHVVIAKPLHTFGRQASVIVARDAAGVGDVVVFHCRLQHHRQLDFVLDPPDRRAADDHGFWEGSEGLLGWPNSFGGVDAERLVVGRGGADDVRRGKGERDGVVLLDR